MSQRDRRTSGVVCAAHNCIRSNRDGAAMFSLPYASLQSLKDCVLIMRTNKNCAKKGAFKNKLPENVEDKRVIMRWLSKYAIVDEITKVPVMFADWKDYDFKRSGEERLRWWKYCQREEPCGSIWLNDRLAICEHHFEVFYFTASQYIIYIYIYIYHLITLLG